MSATIPPDRSDLQNLWKEAISAFEESSKTRLNDAKFAGMIGHDVSIDKIEAALAAYGTDLKDFRKKGQTVRRAFKPFLKVLNTIVDPVGEVVSFVGVPGGKLIFVAAIDGVSQVYDHLTDVLEQIQDVFSRLQILSDANAITPALRKLYVQTLSQVLVILGFYIKYSDAVRRESKWLNGLKVWSTRGRDLVSSAAENTDIQDAVTKLDKLGSRIQQATATETMASSAKTLRNTYTIMETQVTDGPPEMRQEHAWLAAPDPNKNQDERRKQGSGLPDYGQWLIDLPEFQKWLANPTGFFWVSANAGVGKSVLFSRVVDYLRENQFNSGAAFAFFYFDYRDEAKQNYQKFLASIVQSFGETSTSCQVLLRSLEKRSPNASESELESLLQSMLNTPGAKFLAIDAIDECWETERAKSLLPLLQKLSNAQSSGRGTVQIFVTSRPEPDIEEALWALDGTDRVATDRVSLGEREEHLTHLKDVIHAELKSNRFKGLGWSESFIKDVEYELFNRSDSMFLWVEIQLQQLMKCSENDARRILPKLPRGLEGTYARILETVDENRQRTVRAVLECIISAARPLSEKEIGEIFLFDLDSIYEQPSCLPIGNTDIALENLKEPLSDAKDFVNIFKLLPSGLLRHGAHDEVSFIHFTVQEYLLSRPSSSSRHPSQSSDGMHAIFGTSREKAHATASLISLSALDDKNRKSLPSIGKYGDESWFIHARAAMSEHSSIAPALANFLHPESTSFNNWAVRRYSALLKAPSPPHRWHEALHSKDIEPVGQDHPIHWAVRIGSLSDVRRLLSLGGFPGNGDPGTDIRNVHDIVGWTPLCYAACIGDMPILDILLDGNDSWALQAVGPKHENLTIIHLLLPKTRWSEAPGSTENMLGSGGFTDHCVDLLVWPAIHDWSETSACVDAIQKLLTVAPSPTDILSSHDSTGQTPLGQVMGGRFCQSSHELEIVRILMDHGAIPEPKMSFFLMPYACQTSDASIITTFANKYGADLINGRTLRRAIREESVECVQALLDLHVDPNTSEYAGKGALEYALEYHRPWNSIIEEAPPGYKPNAKQLQIYELLKQHGAELGHVSGVSS
ncbi:hypothetical protein DL93DRAFT_2174062 [Clavulina sp. PMI_390]|nr:hypothetical protein DL93DRAFT_2174062 [Clavulina sp. PMI_390]